MVYICLSKKLPMKNNYLLLLSAGMILSTGSAHAQLGSGTSNDPYQITNCDELQKMETKLTSYWILMNDVDCAQTQTGGGQWTTTGFRPIGADSTAAFMGNFNGKCFVVKNLYINRPSQNCVGLFGYAKTATITGVGLINAYIKGNDFTGGVIGYKLSTTTDNCFSNGYVKGAGYTGGIMGRSINYQGTQASLINCFSKADIEGGNRTGGVAGIVTTYQGGGSYITNCFSEGNVTGLNSVGGVSGDCATYQGGSAQLMNCYAKGNVSGSVNVGGLSGEVGPLMGGGGYVIQSYATGNVSGTTAVGGLVGDFGPNSGGATQIYNTYATGNVNGTDRIGGLVGNDYSIGTGWGIDTSYSAGIVTGTTNKGGFVGYESGTATYNTDYWNNTVNPSLQDIGNLGNNAGIFASSTAQMQTQGTYTSWDFTKVWIMSNGGYPVLRANITGSGSCNSATMLKAAFNYNVKKNCENDTVPFIDKSNGQPTGWNWNFGDPSSGVNNTSTLQNPAHRFTSAGTYMVKLVSTKGTSKDSVTTPIIVINCTTGAPEKEAAASMLSLYPNPSKGEFIMSFYSAQAQKAELSVLNSLGQEVMTQALAVHAGANGIPVKLDVPAGIYFVKLRVADSIIAEKLMVR